MADIIGTALIRILPDMSRFGPSMSSGLANATGITGKLARGLDGIATKANRVATSMRGVTLGIGLIGGVAFKAAMDFESAMKEVQAVTGSTGEEFQRLEAAAISAGKTGLFSAKESALGLSELARAGMTTNESIAALTPVLKLASAANMGVADTAKVAVTQMNVFGLQAVDTARIADSIAEADFRSITSMEELSSALAYAGPVAEKAGLSFEETAASLAMMANAGFRGSMGGTALRSIFARLLAPSEKAAGILKDLGIKVTDAAGNMLPLVDIMKQFEKANLTAADAMTIFGQRGGPGFLGFLKQGDEALTELTKEVQLAGGEVETMSKKFGLTKAAGKDLKSAFRDTVAVADEMKYNINETSVLLASYVDSGMSAKEASTQLTKTLGVLDSDGFAKIIGATRDADGRLIDSEGNVLSLAQRFGELQSAASHGAEGVDKLKLSQQDLAFMTDEGIQKMLDYTKANENSGRVTDVAAIKMDSMQGSLKRLRGALEAAAILFMDSGFLNFFAGIADHMAEFVNKINQVNPEILKFVGIAAVLLAAVSPIAYIVQFFATSLATLLGVVSAILTPLGLLAAMAASVIGYFVLMYQNSERLRTSIGFLFEVVKWAAGQIKDMVVGSSDAGKAMEGFADKAGKVGDTFAGWIDSVSAAIPGMVDSIAGFLSIMKEGFLDAIPVIMTFVKGAMGGVVIAFKILQPFIVAVVVIIGSLLVVLSKFMTFLSNHLGAVKAFGVMFGVYLVMQLNLFGRAFDALGIRMASRLTAMGVGLVRFGASMQTGMMSGLPGISRVGAAIQNLGIRLVNGLGRNLVTGVQTSLAAVASFAAGTFLGMAEDATSSLTAITGVAMSVFQGFQSGGAVGALIAAGTAAIGYFFGQAQKKAREAKADMKAFEDLTRQFSEAFKEADVGAWSSNAAKSLVSLQEINKMLGETGDRGTQARIAFNNLQVDMATVATALGGGERGMRALNDEIDRAVNRKASIITKQSLDGIVATGEFSKLTTKALEELMMASSDFTNLDNEKAFEELADAKSLKEFIAIAQEYDLALGDAESTTLAFTESMQGLIAGTDAVAFLKDLPKAISGALREQEANMEIQRLITIEQEKNRGAAVKFSEAYGSVTESLNTATTAYNNWLTVMQGGDVPLANVKLNLVDTAKQLQALASDETLSDFEKANKELSLTATASQQAGDAIGRFINESGGSYETFSGKIGAFREELVGGFAESMKIPRDEAAALVDKILQIPDEKQFKILADTESAIAGLADIQGRIGTYVTSNPSTTLGLQTGTAEERAAKMELILKDYASKHPEAKAFLDAQDVETKKALVDAILAQVDGRKVTITFDAFLTGGFNRALTSLNEGIARATAAASGKPLPGGADGGIFTAPTAMLIGEAGPEVLIPLSDPARAAELAGKSGLLDVLSNGSLTAPAEGALTAPAIAVGVSGEDVTGPVDTGFESLAPDAIAALSTFGETVWGAVAPSFMFLQTSILAVFQALTAYLVAFPLQTWTLMMPGLVAFSTNLTTAFQTTATSVQSVFATMSTSIVTTFAAMLSALAASSTTGGASIVSNLSTALSAGTSAVAEIVSSYALSLANSLNPILRAIGEKDIDVKKFAKGGVNDPRIVPDGSYDVHVFGESGTHGEAYIPFNPANRNRSRAIAMETVARLGGEATFFAGGGVTGNTKGLDPRFMNRLGLWGQAVGENYVVGSGYRSIARQAEMYAAYLAGTKKERTAPPGRSMHNYGLASDGSHWRNRNPGAFGLTFPMGDEPWHVQPVEAAAWRAAMQNGMPMAPDGGFPGMTPMPDVPNAGTKGVISDVAGKLMGAAHDKALSWAGSQGGMSGGASMPVLGELPVNIKHILATIMALESGGNYSARNPHSSASGAYQFTGETWGGYGGFPAAYLAPPSVQDAKAAANVQGILSKYGNALESVPAAWYTGSYRGHGRLDYNPGGPGNPLSVQEYVNKWLAKYASIPGFADGAFFNEGATLGIMGEAGPEVLLPMGQPTRALQLAVDSGLMQMLDEERRRATVPARRAPAGREYPDDGLLGGTGNTYHLTGVGLEQVKAEIRARDNAVDRRRR